jgi:hypothetical protein
MKARQFLLPASAEEYFEMDRPLHGQRRVFERTRLNSGDGSVAVAKLLAIRDEWMREIADDMNDMIKTGVAE